MKELEQYVRDRCLKELDIVSSQMSSKHRSSLTNEEKALIYKYTDDGFYVNERLREGKQLKIPFAEYLDFALSKLPNYEGFVFRGAKLSRSQIVRYQYAYETDTVVIEPSFLSCTLSKGVAQQFGTAIFEIRVKNGKLIEKFSKFGSNFNLNEFEVLLRKSAKFLITGIEEKENYIIITAEEI